MLGTLLEHLLHRCAAVRLPSGGPGAAALPAVRLHRVRRGSGGRPGRLRGDPHQRAAAHSGVRRVAAQRCRDRGETTRSHCAIGGVGLASYEIWR